MPRFLILPVLISLASCASVPAAAPDHSRLGLHPDPNTCNSHRHAALIGRHVTESPRHLEGTLHRIAGLNAPVTGDYIAHRINVFFDERTQRIVGIRCG